VIALQIRFEDEKVLAMLERRPKEMRAGIMMGLRRAANLIADRAKMSAPGRFGVLRASIGVRLDESTLTAWGRFAPEREGDGQQRGGEELRLLRGAWPRCWTDAAAECVAALGEALRAWRIR
jgi:hypothetical protein